MTAAEKYAELEAAGLERPLCKCHGRPKTWSKERPGEGKWQCRIKRRQRRRVTPGTYEFHYHNGIGTPGLTKRLHKRAQLRRRSNAKDIAVLSELKATYPEIWEVING